MPASPAVRSLTPVMPAAARLRRPASVHAVADLSLRAFTVEDVRLLARVDSEFEHFGVKSPLRPPPACQWAEPGALVVVEGEVVLGDVSWYRPTHGPGEGSRTFGIGIGLLPTARGRGVGTWAQRELVRLIFLHTPVNRVEAGTDVTNLPEQRALGKAGFTREGVLRGAQWRLGSWHDMVLFSRLRADPEPSPTDQRFPCHK